MSNVPPYPPQARDDAFNESGQGDGLNLGRVIWDHVGLVLACAILGVGLGYLKFTKTPPTYQSSASILITRTDSYLPVQGLDATAMANRQSALTTQSFLIQSPVVVGLALGGEASAGTKTLDPLAHDIEVELGVSNPEAPAKVTGTSDAKKSGLHSLRTVAGNADPAGTILRGLQVRPARDSAEVLNLSFSGPVKEDCQAILAAVCESYSAYLQGSRDGHTQNALILIQGAKDGLSNDLAKIEEEYRKFRAEHGHLLFKGERGLNKHVSLMADIETARAGLVLQRSQTMAQLQTIENAYKRGDSRQALLLLLDKTQSEYGRNDTTTHSLAASLLPLLLEEQQLLEMFGKDHPKVNSVRKRIQMTRDFLSEQAGQSSASGTGEPSRGDLLEIYLDSLRQEVAIIDKKDAELAQQFLVQQEAAKNLEQLEAEDSRFATQVARKRQLFDVVIKRLEEISLANTAGGFEASVISAARPAYQVAPSRPMNLGVGGLLGLVVGGCLAYLIEVTDKRFRNPEDVERDLQIPVVGHVPMIASKSLRKRKHQELSPVLCTFHEPLSRPSEAYRAVRTSLFFNSKDRARIIQVTSPLPGDGKSTLSSNLSVSIAQAGNSVLVIDADFRRPTIHKAFGASREPGLSSVIRGTIEWPEAVIQTPVPQLSLMSCGPMVRNPSELLTSPRFRELLDVLRERYDYVIVDTPPVLAVSDPVIVAPQVDGVYLVVRISNKSRRPAMQAASTLLSHRARMLGVVVNGISSGRRGGYGYGSYGYGYRYGESYGTDVYYQVADPESSSEMAVMTGPSGINGKHS